MKRIFSLLLAFLLCLSVPFGYVWADDVEVSYIITPAEGVNTSSDSYLNIYKYLVYLEDGQILYLPSNHITVGEWKYNISNPALNYGNLSDGDYIDNTCTLTYVANDNVTEKTVYIETVKTNELYKKYDKKQTTTFDNNNLGISIRSSRTATKGVVKTDEGYALTIKSPSTPTSNSWYNIDQSLTDIKKDIGDTPYIIDMTVQYDMPGVSDVTCAFSIFDGTNYTIKPAASITNGRQAIKNKFINNQPVQVTVQVFPRANLASIYVDGTWIRNLKLVSGNYDYTDYVQFFFRTTNNTKTGDGKYYDFTGMTTDYEIRYGFGSVDADVLDVNIDNYTDGAKIYNSEVEDVSVFVNVDGYKNAVLYVDGYKITESEMSGRSASLPLSGDVMGYGKHEIQVRLYPEYGEYVSKTITVYVEEAIESGSYVLNYEDCPVGIVSTYVPAGIHNDFTSFNYASTDHRFEVISGNNGKYVYSPAGAPANSRINATFNTSKAYDAKFKFDFCYEEIGKNDIFVIVRPNDARGTPNNVPTTFIILDEDGTLNARFTEGNVELGKVSKNIWYRLELDLHHVRDGSVDISFFEYTDGGEQLLSEKSGVIKASNPIKFVDELRVQPNQLPLCVDNISATPVFYSGDITSINADALNRNTVELNIDANSVENVELYNSIGKIKIFDYELADGVLTITTAQPIVKEQMYYVKVYADNNLYPFTKGFEIGGKYVKVTDSYFKNSMGNYYAVLNINNTTSNDVVAAVVVTKWNGKQFISMNAENINVVSGNNEYTVNLGTEKPSEIKVIPVSLYPKTRLLSDGPILK